MEYQRKCEHWLVAIFYLILSAEFTSTTSCADPGFVYVLDDCIMMEWIFRSESQCLQSSQYTVSVNRCNGNESTFQIPYYHSMSYGNGKGILAIDPSFCGEKCIIQFQDSSVCVLLVPSSAHIQNQRRYHCSAECVPVASDDPCQRHTVEYQVSNFMNGDNFRVCFPTYDGNCITELRDCMPENEQVYEILLIKNCISTVTTPSSLPPHAQCESKEDSVWLNGCIHLLVPLSQTIISSASNCTPNHQILECPTNVHIGDSTRNGSSVNVTTTKEPSTEKNEARNCQSRIWTAADVNILSIVFAFVMINGLSKCTLLVVIVALAGCVEGIKFGESDVFVREGQHPRLIPIQRRADVEYPLEIKVHSTTIQKYNQYHHQMGCNLTLDEIIGIQDTNVDPAEEDDFKQHEYVVKFDVGIHEAFISLEAQDDHLSEKEEIFIMYFEASSDNCALAVSIIDNDWLLFNFSTSFATLKENGFNVQYLDLFIIKNGQNEPNVTVEIAVSELLQDVKGVDFDLLETHYVFDNETSRQRVLITVYDDLILEAEEHFLLYFSTLSTNSDVLLIKETTPNSMRVTLQDDEVAVAGFQVERDLILQEGGGSATICVGFDSAMDGIEIDSEVFIIFTITDSPPIVPETGHDLILEPSATLYIDKFSNQDCLRISSAYDTNLNESEHVLSLLIRDTTLTDVIFSQQNLTVYIEDYHGVVFKSEPINATTGAGMDVHFDCDYLGTHASPIWNITYPTGLSTIVSSTRLPHNHILTSKGLTIMDVDEAQNMTSYACLFQIYNRDQIVIISSNPGTLIVLDTVRFDFQLRVESDFEPSTSHKTIELFQGDRIPSVTIKMFGYSSDTFITIVRIKSLNNESDRCNTPFVEQILWYAFDAKANEHTIPDMALGQVLQHPNNYLIEIVSPVSSIEDSGAQVLVPEPIHIHNYDKDYSVGFTEHNVSLQEQVKEEVCLTTFNCNLHPTTYINVTLFPREKIDDDCLMLEVNNIVLNTTSTTGCTTVLMTNYEACGGKRNIILMAMVEVVREKNVTGLGTLQHPYNVITVSLNKPDIKDCQDLIIANAISICGAAIVVIMTIILCSVIAIKAHHSKTGDTVSESGSNKTRITKSVESAITEEVLPP